jgi:hypothetical protein
MKTPPFTWLLVVLIALAGGGTWIIQHRSSPGTGGKGDVLLKELPLTDIAFIKIQGADNEVALAKKAGRWVVENRYDYPADFTKISDFVHKLKNAKIGRRFPVREDVRKRLRLNRPTQPGMGEAEKGIEVQIKNSAGDMVADVLFGIARRLDGTGVPDSQYLMFGESSSVYLVDTPFSALAKAPQEWLDAPIIEVPAKQIRKIELYRPDIDTPAYVVERAAVGADLVPVLQPNQNALEESLVNRIEWAMTYLPLQDILPARVDPAALGLPGSIRWVYYLFDGTSYKVSLCNTCSEAKPYYVAIEVDYKKPDSRPSNLSDTLPDEAFVKAKTLSERLGNWIYIISAGHHSNFITGLDKLL